MTKMPTPTMQDICRRLEEATGKVPPMTRVQKALEFCQSHGLGAEEVEFVNHQDRFWSERGVRTDLERLAVCVGYTNAWSSDVKNERWWVVPLREPRRRAA